MAYGRISDKQKEILEYMKQEILNKGYPPTVRDICEAVKLKSTSSVHSHLETLEKNGYIRRDPTKPRAIEIIDDNTLRMRVWERGSGETFACGTGACAVAVACILNGLTEDKVTVKLLGGDLQIEWDKEADKVYMTGPAVKICEGTLEV